MSVARPSIASISDRPEVGIITRKRLLIACGIAMVAFDIVILLIDQRLEATGGPSILGLEFAGSTGRAAEVMAEWGDHGQYLARLSLWIDFGFMLSYGSFFALAALATRDFARERGLRALAIAGIAAPIFAVSAAVSTPPKTSSGSLFSAATGERPGLPSQLSAPASSSC